VPATLIPDADPDSTARPADGLLHPVVLVAMAVLALNDQLLKAAWPGFVTGKLSDVAGLIVAPLALQAAWEVASWVVGRWRGPSTRVLALSIAVVGLGFAAIQVWEPATDAYRWGLGFAQWPFRAVAAAMAGGPIPSLVPVVALADAEDLLALPALAVTWWLGRRRIATARPAPRHSRQGPAASNGMP
jgi:hypothetical protein